jgi:hypothetical protein
MVNPSFSNWAMASSSQTLTTYVTIYHRVPTVWATNPFLVRQISEVTGLELLVEVPILRQWRGLLEEIHVGSGKKQLLVCLYPFLFTSSNYWYLLIIYLTRNACSLIFHIPKRGHGHVQHIPWRPWRHLICCGSPHGWSLLQQDALQLLSWLIDVDVFAPVKGPENHRNVHTRRRLMKRWQWTSLYKWKF